MCEGYIFEVLVYHIPDVIKVSHSFDAFPWPDITAEMAKLRGVRSCPWVEIAWRQVYKEDTRGGTTLHPLS